MKNLSYLCSLFLIIFVTGCAGSSKVVAPASSEKNETAETKEAPQPEKEILTATNDWYLKTPVNSPYFGTGLEKAWNEILSGKEPVREVIVAIIDSGTDIHHEDLKENIWVNADEIPGNNKDDDGNGYTDDIYGWNFIGGPDSTHVAKDTYELTRLYAKYSERFSGVSVDSLTAEEKEDYSYYKEIKHSWQKRVEQNNQTILQVQQFMQAVTMAKELLNISNLDSVETGEIKSLKSNQPGAAQAKQIMMALKSNGVKESDISDANEYLDHLMKLKNYGLNPEFNPRGIVGDDYEDLSDRWYGNNDVKGPDSDHGTHVAGIVSAVRDNNIGVSGFGNSIRLMIIRTVPDGDERDKDVGNAIRYAAENGASVINMSFGKGYSPQKHYVDAAVRYADSLGVLMVSGAGNDGKNIDDETSYPSPYYLNGSMAENYLTVGASSWESDSTLAAGFSNYGKEKVDLFAPGVAIYSTMPENEYEMQDGTSMASPVVAGAAALLMSYYPEFTTTEIKELLLDSVSPVMAKTKKPGSGEVIPFSELSASGGIINIHKALELAEQRSNQQ